MAKRLLTTQRIVNLSSDPISATAGEVYYNTSINSLKYYDGSQWSVIGSGEGGANVTVSENPPASPQLGDLWYESDTAKIFIYYDNAWIEIGGGGGGGDSLPDQTGNSGKFLSTDGTNPLWATISGGTSLNVADTIVARDSEQSFDITAIDFDTADNIASAVGRLTWNDGEGTLNLGLKGGNLDLQIGQENIALCYNGTGSEITKGSVVYISGAQGQRPSISLADADTEATSSKTFGIVAENILNGTEGFVATFGVVPGVNTSEFTAGQALWLSSTAGQLTNVKPTQPAHSVFIGYCLHVNQSSGRIFVNPQNGYEIEELHNVLISTPADNHILSYDNATSLWKNQGLAAAIQEIDGASSGIDADLLDGQHGSYYAPIDSPALTGIPTAPTAAAATNTTQIATTAFVRTEVSNLVDAAPATLDTLNELAAALGDDANFSTTVTNSLALKAPLASPTFTGTVTVPTPVNATDAATKGYVDNLAVEEVYYQAAAPTSIPVGTVWVESDVDVSETTYHTTYAADAPTSPVLGDLWIESDVDLESFNIVPTPVGQTGKYLSSDGTDIVWSTVDALPSQTGNSGKYLTTDGTNASWSFVENLPSQTGNAGEFLTTNGTSVSWSNTITSNSTSTVAIIAKGVASQTANLQEWQNSSSTVVASISNTGAFTATTKSFDIEHPTKEGMRLRYGSLEGPENGVYVRGKSSSSEITLPDYWVGLVDENSITVQLTPVGKRQDLFVEEIDDNAVTVGGVEGEFFYFIQAERKDVDKLVVEY